MFKILWKRGEIAPEEQFFLLSTIFCYSILDFYVKTRIRFSVRDKRLFEITKEGQLYCSVHSPPTLEGPYFITLKKSPLDLI